MDSRQLPCAICRGLERLLNDDVLNANGNERALVVADERLSQLSQQTPPSGAVADTDLCLMGPPGARKPVLAPREPLPPRHGVYYIAHNRFGYLPHLNTLSLQLTRGGRLDQQRKSLANPLAFEEMIKRNRVSEHSEFLTRLSQIEQWPDCEFAPPPPPPPSTLPLASLSYTCKEITDAFQNLSKQPFEYVGAGTYTTKVEGEIVVSEMDKGKIVPDVQHALDRNSSL